LLKPVQKSSRIPIDGGSWIRSFCSVTRASRNNFQHYPKNVGIIAMDSYFPKTFVRQVDLEQYDKVSAGKYTIGLEQEAMAFTTDREDICSMCLTVVQSLMEKYNIDYKSIGRLEVGTETLVDKSKSIKSVLMSLFEKSGNFNVEGIDTINACYGGTSALMNAVNWIESSTWDGRFALVVCGDIAVYSVGAARPTGGAGVVAMLVGKDALITLERGVRGTHMEHVYDFYKPNLDSEYPLVDGQLSISCYYRALDNCYRIYRDSFQHTYGKPFSMENADYAIFHSPFLKLVRKSFARLHYLDFLADHLRHQPRYKQVSESLRKLTAEQSYNDKELQKVFGDLTTADYREKVDPATLLPKQLGNSYTASLYMGLLSLIDQRADKELLGKRILMFSYGSGLASTMFSFEIRSSLANIAEKANISHRLAQRVPVKPDVYSESMKLRESTHSATNYTPVSPLTDLFPGTFYLAKIDAEKRRYYQRL